MPTRLSAEEIIFDNTANILGVTTYSSSSSGPNQVGDEVHAGGTSRVVTFMQVGVTMLALNYYPGGTADIQARLYANDGLEGAPGSVLWDSGLLPQIPISGNSTTMVSFDVPQITVPDIFTWTVQIFNSSPTRIGVNHAGPESIGSSPDHAWVYGPFGWRHLLYAPGNVPSPLDFAARIVAVPEPPLGQFLVTGAAVLGGATGVRRLLSHRRKCASNRSASNLF